MPQETAADILNELLAIEYHSLPMYLADAHPWVGPRHAQFATLLANIVTDQKANASRLAQAILDRHGKLEAGAFPMEFTDLNMLGTDFLLRETIRLAEIDLADISGCVARLSFDPLARELAEEVLGSEMAHLEQLKQLVDADAAASRS